eukprot:Protomagalhaensia_sp_Gyna_25__4946@NODE_534_length_3185_cov_654_468531_g418_i0_p2_GENE_NODE_534_length_3185_cov_654_468531_g418_i0NODE_534_length_3185_cov_654_468531_g418_i0_p2_ORF_typecomplete_len334_score48_88_NODE_534_length_3185_cov_654_468531_g418_i04051406
MVVTRRQRKVVVEVEVSSDDSPSRRQAKRTFQKPKGPTSKKTLVNKTEKSVQTATQQQKRTRSRQPRTISTAPVSQQPDASAIDKAALDLLTKFVTTAGRIADGLGNMNALADFVTEAGRIANGIDTMNQKLAFLCAARQVADMQQPVTATRDMAERVASPATSVSPVNPEIRQEAESSNTTQLLKRKRHDNPLQEMDYQEPSHEEDMADAEGNNTMQEKTHQESNHENTWMESQNEPVSGIWTPELQENDSASMSLSAGIGEDFHGSSGNEAGVLEVPPVTEEEVQLSSLQESVVESTPGESIPLSGHLEEAETSGTGEMLEMADDTCKTDE